MSGHGLMSGERFFPAKCGRDLGGGLEFVTDKVEIVAGIGGAAVTVAKMYESGVGGAKQQTHDRMTDADRGELERCVIAVVGGELEGVSLRWIVETDV